MACYTFVAKHLTITFGLNWVIGVGPMRMYSPISKNRRTLNVDQIILGVKAGFLTSQICTNVMT